MAGPWDKVLVCCAAAMALCLVGAAVYGNAVQWSVVRCDPPCVHQNSTLGWKQKLCNSNGCKTDANFDVWIISRGVQLFVSSLHVFLSLVWVAGIGVRTPFEYSCCASAWTSCMAAICIANLILWATLVQNYWLPNEATLDSGWYIAMLASVMYLVCSWVMCCASYAWKHQALTRRSDEEMIPITSHAA